MTNKLKSNIDTSLTTLKTDKGPAGLMTKRKKNTPYPMPLSPEEHMILVTKMNEMNELSRSSRSIKKIDALRTAIQLLSMTDAKTCLKVYSKAYTDV